MHLSSWPSTCNIVPNMNPTIQLHPISDAAATPFAVDAGARKPYHAPNLQDHGAIEETTQGLPFGPLALS